MGGSFQLNPCVFVFAKTNDTDSQCLLGTHFVFIWSPGIMETPNID